jgi:hypothetical protein
MNKEQIIDEVHQNYVKETMFDSNPKWLESVPVMDMKTGEKSMGVRQYGKESFINKCKTDSEFSEKWGLKIEERELTPKERIELAGGKIQDKYPALVEMSLRVCDERDIPTKLITITFNNEKIEDYE